MSSHPDLTLRRGFWGDPAAAAAYARLMLDVFNIDVAARDALCGSDPTCRASAFFDVSGACVASAEAFILPLVLSGARNDAAAIRSVAVASHRRGQGLFRATMTDLLAQCEGSLALLYAEHAALYTPFGFRPLSQHKFVGHTPPAASTPSSATRRLIFCRKQDLALLGRLLAQRSPVSNTVAIDGGASLFLDRAGDYALTYSTAHDAVIVSNEDADAFTLVDVVAAQIPTLAEIVSVLRPKSFVTEVLFPPDKLQWHGIATPDDTGLMMRGPEAAAFQRSFMLPPTTEF